jgi:uncharacterized membrane protein YqiK
MEIKLSDINTLKKIQVQSPTKWMEKVVIIILAIVLAILTWYILNSVSTVLVIEKDKTGKKICDFN